MHHATEQSQATLAWLRHNLPHASCHNTRLVANSRRVAAGDIFLAWPGAHVDARQYIGDAIERGAQAVIWDDAAPFAWNPNHAVANHAQRELKYNAGVIAAAWYEQPMQHLLSIGITGTSGKSSCAWWLAQALNALDQDRTRPCALVGTLGVGLIDALVSTGLTTPDPVNLQASLSGLLQAGARAVAMEVSSIGIVEGRINGAHFDIALFTNLSHDHLDYHQTMAGYQAAKAHLFSWPGLKTAVINSDDDAAAAIVKASSAQVLRYSAAGSTQADLWARQIESQAHGLQFQVCGAFGVRKVTTQLLGAYNVANFLGVLGVLLAAEIDIDDALTALQSISPVPGRLERVPATHGPLVLIDYAHKPDALDKVLSACRPLAQARGGRLSVLLGCGGNRDASKRSLMGAIAARRADQVIITNDNPRFENPHEIAAAIVAGIQALEPQVQYRVELDRHSAIHSTIANALAQDVIVLAGKGHETEQEVMGVKTPFSDLHEASAALEQWSPPC